MANQEATISVDPNLRKWFYLFWSIYPDAAAIANWERAGKPGLMVTLAMIMGSSGPGFITQLKALGVPVIIRAEEPDVYHIPPPTIRATLEAALQAGLPIAAFIAGVEPDNGYTWRYARPGESFDWGQDFAYYHAGVIRNIARAIKGRGIGNIKIGEALPIPVIAPGWACRDFWEYAPPQPGFMTWRDICRDGGYWETDGFGLHSYSAYWDDIEEPIRHLKRLQTNLTAFHMGPAYIDEVGVLDAPSQTLRMRGYIRLANAIWSSHYRGFVGMFCPFVSAGVPKPDPTKPPAWDPRYLLTDPRAYAMLGEYLLRGTIPV